MKKLAVVMCVLALMLAPATAQAQFSLGAQGNWGDDTDWGVGGRATYDLSPRGVPLAIYATYDYFWPRSTALLQRDYWEVNINAAFVQPVGGPRAQSYFALGLNIADFSTRDPISGESASTTKYGLNLIGGSKYKLSRLAPFFEIRYVIEGSKQLVLTAGVDLLFGEAY
jgi:hypothetical protein